MNIHGGKNKEKWGGRAKSEIENQKKKEVKRGAGEDATEMKLRTEQIWSICAMTSEQNFQRFQ